MATDAVLLAALGIVSAAVAGFIWVIKFMFTKLLPAIDKTNVLAEKGIAMAGANTKATKSADSYLRERNGRDGEKHAELLKATKQIPATMQKIADAQSAAIIKAVDIREQHVEHQHIDKQDIGKKR